jgi:hypothetical protein
MLRMLFKLIEMYLNEMHNKVCLGKNLSEIFPLQKGLKQGDMLYHNCFSNLL